MNKAKLLKTLGLGPKATLKEVRKRYRRLARRYHPDMNPGDPDAEKRFIVITEAYEALRSMPSGEWQGRSRCAGARTSGDRSTESSIFEVFGIRGREGPGVFGRGINLRFDLEVSPTRAARGGMETIDYTRLEDCCLCNGNGALPQSVSCSFCNGDGVVSALRSVSVDIPPKILDGTRLTIRGGGERPVDGGPPGDLIVVVHVAQNPGLLDPEE